MLGTCIGAIHPKFPQPIWFPSEKNQLCMSEQLVQRLRTCSAEGIPLRRGFPNYPRPAVFPSQNACKVDWAQLCLRHRHLSQLLILRVDMWGGQSIPSGVRVTYMAPLPPVPIAETDNINEYLLFSAELNMASKSFCIVIDRSWNLRWSTFFSSVLKIKVCYEEYTMKEIQDKRW